MRYCSRLSVVVRGLALGAGLWFAGAQQVDAQVYPGYMARAAVAISTGDWPGGVAAAQAAFAAAGSDFERLNAARLVASAYFRAGQFSRAEWWLRRAANNAPNDAASNAVAQDFARVRQENPLTVRLNFSAAPNSNINNGSSSEIIEIWNLPFVLSPDAQALAGFEVSGGVDLRYRISQSPDYATDIGLLLSARTYALSEAASAAAPGVSGSDYAFWAAEVMLRHTRKFAALSAPTVFSLNAGKNWYGGAPYTRYVRATLGQSFRLSETTGLDVSAGYERQISLTSGFGADIYSLSGGVSRRLTSGDGISASLRLQQTVSDDPGTENTALRAAVRYGFGKPVLGTQLALNLSAEQRSYDFSVYDVDGRQDLTLSLGVNMVLVEASYFGFSPSIAIELNQTTSNVSLFDRASAALRFGVQSTF